ncbi:protein-disulfide reductase DsbD domain-containing protein [Sphingobacterium tabacisoli]|uniref:Protein-disulfide reductase DsbD domain-containing protein n=1 Tax=Sphingobacterium tabacisoli TaxID=2044855 RepID=A0ABW5KYZ5_9SPHI|nr:protein-disulfide reductase DsbD domain-containing protein [Sphingobacterium tabacisoli]
MNIRKWIVLIVILQCSLLSFAQKGGAPLSLRVLYVGGSANWEKDAFANDADRDKDVQRRKASFETMLKRYFTDVHIIDAGDYTQELSRQYDVTVMDGTPQPIASRQVIKDDAGNVTKYIPAAYLTEDFDSPMLFIGEMGEKMGRSIGLKMDWYCLCLDAHAHHYRKEHAIFKGPFKVKITEEKLPTPEDAFHYEYFLGKTTPKELNMWRVQTKGYVTDKGFRIGMVARPWGFEDSPEAESISSGVCAKTLDAVAIGRHGNFFHWGFAASPEYLTQEAQVVLANAVAYIATFKGKHVIARKYLDRRATKEYIKEKKYYASREAYEGSVKMNEDFDQRMLAEKAKAEAKQASGQEVTAEDKRYLSYTVQPKMSFEDFLKKHQTDLFGRFGTDSEAYAKYYDENLDFFYSEDASYKITVDEDVKSLGIPNTDPRLLAQCITMLEKGMAVDKAKRILERYTLLRFDSSKDWRNWYEKNKTKIFFTQTGGFYFMVDTQDKTEPANNYKAKEEKKDVSYDKVVVGDTDHDRAVNAAVGVVELSPSKKEVVVKVKIHPGYHIYAFVSDQDPYVQTEVDVKVSGSYTKKGELRLPSFKYFNNKGTTIYENEIVFIQEIEGSGSGAIEIELSYQCCDSQICFPPATEKLKIVI